MNNLEEYSDPMEYDCEYGKPEPECSFYSQIAKRVGDPILEIACGTGRITIPLALQGFKVTGIDVCEGMIKRGIEKTTKIPIEFKVSDCRTFELDQRFQMVFMTGNSFQALLTRVDQEMLLQSVRKHLSSNGIFAFDTRFPSLAELSKTSTEEEYWHTYINSKGLSVSVSGCHIYDPINQIAEYTTFRRWLENDQPKMRKTKISIRYTFPLEMEALLYYNGFKIEQRFGNWDRTILKANDEKMIYLCTLR